MTSEKAPFQQIEIRNKTEWTGFFALKDLHVQVSGYSWNSSRGCPELLRQCLHDANVPRRTEAVKGALEQLKISKLSKIARFYPVEPNLLSNEVQFVAFESPRS